ncbi:MAG: peptidase T, partial [Lachnospiraceae bacterium]|nr:peptidase T [Lachnospiraceae bacterium]
MDVVSRFLKYVSFDTASDEDSESCPSTEKQKLLGEFLAEELEGLGLSDARMDKDGYVYARIPASEGCDAAPVGLISHMDTSPAAPGANVSPRTIMYEGGDIVLGGDAVIKEEMYPSLKRYIGQELIVTDGTTLLGADDKAGVAEIVTAAEYFINHPEVRHGEIFIGFTPDEEIGRGADRFDLEHFKAAYAYTVDGGALGEIEYENFNAAAAHIRINGFNIHPGEAKNKMKNAVLIASEFINMLPPAEIPAHTEGYEGFYHVSGINGDETRADIDMIIRDHDMAAFTARKAYIERTASYINEKYGENTVIADIKDSYYNMKEKI